MTLVTPTKRIALPISSTELVERVLASTTRLPFKSAVVLRAMRASEVSPWSPDDVPKLADLLAGVDADWSVRLQVVHRGLPSRRGEFARQLHLLIVRQARLEVTYPGEEAGTTAVEDWTATALLSSPLRPATLLTAAWPDRRAAWFPDFALALIRAWAGSPAKAPGVAELVARLIGGSGRRRAIEVTRLLAIQSARVDRAVAESAACREESERARRARARAEDEAVGLNAALTSVRGEARDARARIEALEHEVADILARSEHQLLGARTGAANELAQMRAQVLRVLRRELEQLRLYLDRPQPNTADALLRLEHLDQLSRDLSEWGKGSGSA